MKKHITQMTDSEIETLQDKISEVLGSKRRLQFGKHAIERMLERNVEGAEVMQAIRDVDIIEYHLREFDDGRCDNRVLLRSNLQVSGTNFCMVLSVDMCKVITIYLNNADDNHSTLNINNYDKSLAIAI